MQFAHQILGRSPCQVLHQDLLHILICHTIRHCGTFQADVRSVLQAKWANEGLMTDPLSVENGAIMSSASRWSLMIDPQLQGIKWIMNRELPNGLKVIQQSQAKYIDTVISCIETGTPLLMENLPEDIDAVLDPVIGKQPIKRGRNLILKIGDAEVEYDQNFR